MDTRQLARDRVLRLRAQLDDLVTTVVASPAVLDAETLPRELWGRVERGADWVTYRVADRPAGDGDQLLGSALPADMPPLAQGVSVLVGAVPAALVDGRPSPLVLLDPSRYRDRVAALPHAESLLGKTVVLVGLGSVGSEIGTLLARLGVRVVALDHDVLTVENLIRWAVPVDLGREVGRPKVAVWEAVLASTVPGASVRGQVLDVARNLARFRRILEEERPDLLVIATDTRDSRRAANSASVELGLPALYVALSEGAASVRVELVARPGEGPCHLCSLAHELDSGQPNTDASSRGVYGVAVEGGAAPARERAGVPALPIDAAQGALLAARIAVEQLAGGQPDRWMRHGDQRGHVLFMAFAPNVWLFESPWDRFVYKPARRADCPACGVP